MAENERLLELLATLDAPVPEVRAEELMHPVRRGLPLAPLAAVLAGLVLVAGAAALASPGFRAALVRPFQSVITDVRTPPIHTGQGIELAAPNVLLITLPDTPALGTLELRLTESRAVRLESTGSAARFEVGNTAVTVTSAEADTDFVLTIPHSLTRLTVRVGDRVVLTRDGERIVPSRTGTAGVFRVSLSSPASSP